MSDTFSYIAMGVILVIILILISWILRHFRKDSPAKKNLNRSQQASAMGLLVNCPLCNTPLLKGQNLVTKVYRPMTVSDQLCTINGCPHCYPSPEPGIKRICPVCKKQVPLSGHLTARLFNKTDGKKHVIVTGCTECIKNERP